VERCWSGRSGAPGERVAGLPAIAGFLFSLFFHYSSYLVD